MVLIPCVQAQEDPMEVIAEQGAVLEAAPKLSGGSLEFDAETLANSLFVWIEVEQDGLYNLSLSVPGALVLGSFPTVDGRYDGQTKPQQHGSSKSLSEAPLLGPLLLSPTHPYLLSISSGAGAGTLELTLVKAAPALSGRSGSDAAVPPGATLYASSDRVDLTLAGSAEPRRVEIFGEARATLKAFLDSEVVPSGGRYPWLKDKEGKLWFHALAGPESSPPRVLVLVEPATVGLDETEPNEEHPNGLVIDRLFKGHLLRGDQDRLHFSLPVDGHFRLSIKTEDRLGRFSASLLRVAGKSKNELWKRKPPDGALKSAALALTAGDYQLVLERHDGRDVPLPYSVDLTPGEAPGPNQEVEPNDTPDTAMLLPESLRVSASATPDDQDVYRFSVTADKARHLWRVFTVGANRIKLADQDGQFADVRATGRRTMIDSLSLEPGNYQVTVSAEGDYLFRVMDLGPRPTDFEGEPNDRAGDGQRLEFGAGIRGGFHREGDLDYYLFRLDAQSAVEIKIQPAGDGRMDVKLFRGNQQIGDRVAFEPGDAPYVFQSTLPAGDWALAVRSLDPSIQNNYEIGISRLPALAGNEPDDDPFDAVKMPRDGDIAGSVGAFDDADQVFVPLPRGEGMAAMLCTQNPRGKAALWRLYNWSGDGKVADIRNGIALFGYSPELGGAVRFGLDGNDKVVSYGCSLRFPIPATATPVLPGPADPGEVTAGAEAPISLAPGETRRASITADGPEPRFSLELEEAAFAFASCRNAAGRLLEPETRVWDLKGVTLPTRDLFGELRPFIAESEPMITLSRTYAERLEDNALPLEVDCSLYGVDDLPRPGDMGPSAEFRLFEAPASGHDSETTGIPGPPPPGLEALITRKAPERQPEGDLPVTITLGELQEVAGFSGSGQRFTVTAKLVNETASRLNIDLVFSVAGEGWRVSPPDQSLTLEAGATNTVTAGIIAPPWLSPSLRPNLVVRAVSADAFSAVAGELPVSVDALPVNPFMYWHAPEALRGGLNVLHYGLGARLIDWGGKAPDESMQKAESGLHDGLAPHIDSINLPKDIAFSLAATTEVAGVMVQLRSTTGMERWPAEVEVYAPRGESGWVRAGSAILKSVHAPQYLVFESPVTTDRLRFVFPRCNSNCQQVFVQELQAIALPGTHPAGLPPVNAADLELGGHVVWSNQRLGGPWNEAFLVAVPSASNGGWSLNRDQDPARVVIAFHQNRAALLQSLVWVGDPDDTKRIPEALVETSLAGPNGPWAELGRLPAPPVGEVRASLELETPVWSRYLRFSFEIPEDTRHLGPDKIEAIEAPGTSVLALWEDDDSRAAFEALSQMQPAAPAEPAGGANRETAVALPVAEAIVSSAVIERNEDWWRLEISGGPPNRLRLEFERERPLVIAEVYDSGGEPVDLQENGGSGLLEAVLAPGEYFLRIYEPPRSVVISWDTSGSVSHYISRTLAAVRSWGRSLQPGRDALQLLPFGPKGFLLEDWAESPEALEPALRELPQENSSDSEKAMKTAAEELVDRQGARGIVIMTDAETGMNPDLWPSLLKAMPRVVSLSVDSDNRENAAIMMDWAALNGGRFVRVVGPLGLADGMDMANALFRAPKPYGLTATLEELVEPEGDATLTINAKEDTGPAVGGAVELILDASGSMLQRMEGKQRIEIAHKALTGLVNDILPEGTSFAFRAFGLEEGACRTELIVPLGPLDRKAAVEAITSVPAINLAKTAIADSLRATVGDLREASAPRVVVLVTDGEETCDGDPEAAIAEIRAAGLDARLNIVGFAIDDAALAGTFAAWAEAGGGAYFDARSAEALENSISDALRPRFDITRTSLDGRVEVVGRVALGETVVVPAGRLTIVPGSGATGNGVTIQAIADEALALEYEPGAGLRIPGASAE